MFFIAEGRVEVRVYAQDLEQGDGENPNNPVAGTSAAVRSPFALAGGKGRGDGGSVVVPLTGLSGATEGRAGESLPSRSAIALTRTAKRGRKAHRRSVFLQDHDLSHVPFV